MGSEVKDECGTVGFATFEGYDHPTSSGREVNLQLKLVGCRAKQRCECLRYIYDLSSAVLNRFSLRKVNYSSA